MSCRSLVQLASLLSFLIGFTLAVPTLKQVNILFRHGQRSPISANLTAQYSDVWPNGPGQLTQTGKVMMFKLGLFLRERYANLINKSYIAEEVHMKSSDIDRTLMSAQLVLAGLYSPISRPDLWFGAMPWQPIPVHSLQRESDNLIAMSALCSHKAQTTPVWEHMLNEPAYLNTTLHIQPYLDMLKNHSEYTPNEWMDAFMCLNSNNVSLPDWVSGDLYDVSMTAILPLQMKQEFGSVAQQRLAGGPLLGEIVENMKACADTKLCTTHKMKLYSGHDTTIGALMYALGVYNELWPPYATTVMVELYADENGNHSVNLWLRNETLHTPYRLLIPGCGSNCPLEKFKELTKPVIPADWAAECSLYTVMGYTFQQSTWIIGSAAMFVATLFLFVLLITLCCLRRRRRRKRNRFRKMPNSSRESVTLMSSLNDSDEDI